MPDICRATSGDEAWLAAHDHHISPDALHEAVSQGRVYIARDGGAVIGWLRYGLFWDSLPFLNMLYLLDGHRGQGHGTVMMRRWEADMRAAGHPRVLTSTQANETSQHFYRRLGYEDVGGFLLPSDSYELILCKTF